MTGLVPASARARFQLSGEAVDTRWFTPRTQGLMTTGPGWQGILKVLLGQILVWWWDGSLRE